MRFVLHLLVVVGLLFVNWKGYSQATPPQYPLPKPIPSSGGLPNNFIKDGGPYGQSNYQDPYTATYDVLINGGWRSVGTAAERNAIGLFFRKEGMAVYEAATRKIYVLNADLTTWVLLGELTGTPGDTAPNFYTEDSGFDEDRMVTGNAHSLTFANLNMVDIDSQTMTLRAPGGFSIRTFSVQSGVAKSGDVLTFLGANADFRPVPSSVNIYNSDGFLTGNREMDMKGSILTFKGGRINTSGMLSYTLIGSQESTIATEHTLNLQGKLKLNLKTPNVVNGLARSGQWLKLVDGGGGVDFFDLPPGGGGTFELGHYVGNANNGEAGVPTHVRVEDVQPPYTSLEDYPDFTRATVRMGQGNAPDDFFQDTQLALGSGPMYPVMTHQFQLPGVMDIATPAGGGMMEVVFDNANKLWILQDSSPSDVINFIGAESGGGGGSLNELTGDVTLVAGSPEIGINTDSGNVLRIDYYGGPSIYSGSGVLASDRVITAANKDFAVTNAKSLDMRGWTSTVAGTQKFKFITPKISQGLVSTGMVMVLKNLDGTSEYDSLPPDQNIYSADGVLAADRLVTGNLKKFTITNLNALSLSATGRVDFTATKSDMFMASPYKIWMNADGLDLTGTNNINLDGAGQVTVSGNQIDMASISSSAYVSQGPVWFAGTIITNSAGVYWIVATNGMNVHTKGSMFLNADNVNLIGTNGFNLQSSGPTSINGTSVAIAGATSATIAANSGPMWIHGTIITNSAGTYYIVATNGMNVFTKGTVNFDGDEMVIAGTNRIFLQTPGTLEGSSANLTLSSTGPAAISGNTLRLQGLTSLELVTQKITAGTATNGMVFSLTNAATGKGEYMPLIFPSQTVDTSIYTHNGTITSPRTITTGTNTLQITATDGRFTVFDANHATIGAKTNVLYGANELWLSTGTKLRVTTPNSLNGGVARVGDSLRLISLDPASNSGIADFSPATAIPIVNKFADLQTAATNLQYVATSGYYSPGDGGHGYYYLGGGDTNWGNCRSTIDPTKVWRLLLPRDGIYIRQYGAKGDGFTDDSAQFADWIKDINNLVGVMNVGNYVISPTVLDGSNTRVTIRGMSRFNPNGVQEPSGLFLGNCAVLTRKAGSDNGMNLLTITNSAILNLYSIVINGNKPAEANGAIFSLIQNNSGGPCEFQDCLFQNSVGHGIRFGGTNAAGTRVRNCRMFDLRRGVRIDFTYDIRIEGLQISKCYDNSVWVYSSQAITVADSTITDGGANGIAVDGSTDCNFINLLVEGHKKSCLVLDIAPSSVTRCTFSNCIFRDANCAANLDTVVTPSPSGTYSTILTTGNNGNHFITNNRFINCTIGGNNTQPGYNKYGTNAPKYHWEWTATGSGSVKPWEYNTFDANNHRTPIFNAGVDYFPALTNNVVEMGVYRTTGMPSFHFGPMGGVTSLGWRMDTVQGGGAAGTDSTLFVNNTSHRVLKDGTTVGTPLQARTPPPDLPGPRPSRRIPD